MVTNLPKFVSGYLKECCCKTFELFADLWLAPPHQGFCCQRSALASPYTQAEHNEAPGICNVFEEGSCSLISTSCWLLQRWHARAREGKRQQGDDIVWQLGIKLHMGSTIHVGLTAMSTPKCLKMMLQQQQEKGPKHVQQLQAPLARNQYINNFCQIFPVFARMRIHAPHVFTSDITSSRTVLT